MPKQPVSEETQELIHNLIDSVDKCIIADIRSNAAGREALLLQLDVLEKVRERLIVRLAFTD